MKRFRGETYRSNPRSPIQGSRHYEKKKKHLVSLKKSFKRKLRKKKNFSIFFKQAVWPRTDRDRGSEAVFQTMHPMPLTCINLYHQGQTALKNNYAVVKYRFFQRSFLKKCVFCCQINTGSYYKFNIKTRNRYHLINLFFVNYHKLILYFIVILYTPIF